jgi:hypothetical protein
MLRGNKGALSHLRCQYEAHNLAVCLAFTLLHGFTVDVHCCSDCRHDAISSR